MLLSAVALLAILGMTAAPATAADRFVAPGGVGEVCAPPNPCSLEFGINEAQSGDTVHVNGDLGPYSSTVFLGVSSGVSVIGEGSQLPRIVFGSEGRLFVLSGGSVAGLDLSGASGNSGILWVEGGTASALKVDGSIGYPAIVRGLLRDSFVHASGTASAAILTIGMATKLRNVTAIADAEGSAAIRAEGDFDHGLKICNEPSVIELRNVIARGVGFDLLGYGHSLGCTATLEVGFTNYRGAAVSLNSQAVLVDQGGNQTSANPLLAPDGFHQLASSPTIDAGVGTAENGQTDVDREPRSQGSAPDIGADEFNLAPPPPPPLDTLAPVGSRLKFSPRRFRPRRARTPSISSASAKRRRRASRRTSTVTYRLSEGASVRFVIQRRVVGRRKGERCLIGKRARRLRRAKRCRRFVRVRGAFVHRGRPGANRFRFTGYVRGRRLRPGVHRMTGVPTDAAGNRGKRFRASFVIARR